jgi:AraC-like DNA-binding protein
MWEPSLNLTSTLQLISTVLNVALAIVLIVLPRGNKSANRVLAAFLLAFAIVLFEGFVFDANCYFHYPHLQRIGSPVIFLFGPLAFFYVTALTSRGAFAFRWGHLMHLIPFGMKLVLSIPFYLLTAEEKIAVFKNIIAKLSKPASISLDPFLLILVTQIAAYLIASLRQIVVYSSRIKESYSSLDKISLEWLRDVFIALFVLWSFFSFATVYAPAYGVYRESMTALRLMIGSIIFVMGIRGLMQPQVFAQIEPRQLQIEEDPVSSPTPVMVEKRASEQNREGDKYRKSLLTEEQAAAILGQLSATMETERPFLDPELALPGLSSKLGVSPNQLSQVINGKLNKTFFDYINEHRVEEAKKLLLAPQSRHLSILGIAMDAGFNSKNAFYSAFKKYAGTTPAKYRDLHMAEQIRETPRQET